MPGRLGRVAAGVAVTIAIAGRVVGARAEPPLREGLFVGVGLGKENVSWTWPDGQRRDEWSGTASVRAGRALRNDLILGLEFWMWAKDYEVATSTAQVPVDARLSALTLAATYFPGNAGLFVRGGVGVADGRITVTPPPSVDFPISGSFKNDGFGALAAIGYEARLTRLFALGLEGDLVYLGVGGDAVGESAFGYGLNAQFNWYW